jgi:hypothetical protein
MNPIPFYNDWPEDIGDREEEIMDRIYSNISLNNPIKLEEE